MVKMIVAILKDEDSDSVTEALGEMDLCVTRIASTGGFLRQGRSTLMIGVEGEKLNLAIQVIKDRCEPTVGPLNRRGEVYILNVEHFEQL
jgi:uncharacterized protein YaaQ